VVQFDHGALGDLVQVAGAKLGQEVIAQVTIITVPADLVALDEWHVPIFIELGKGRYGA